MAFKKGQSGNPGGRAKIKLPDGRTLTDLAREHTVEAVETLVDVMRNGDTSSARVAAADKILNRGWGAAPQTITITEEPSAIDLAKLSDEQIEVIATIRDIIDAKEQSQTAQKH